MKKFIKKYNSNSKKNEKNGWIEPTSNKYQEKDVFTKELLNQVNNIQKMINNDKSTHLNNKEFNIINNILEQLTLEIRNEWNRQSMIFDAYIHCDEKSYYNKQFKVVKERSRVCDFLIEELYENKLISTVDLSKYLSNNIQDILDSYPSVLINIFS